ncbi:MAG: BatD family protein [Candidatus Omnitrophica bacterium]|nr:BatD family protein [Candidatus Omnitrophota bacterium]MBU4479711.1 BatD family protein [Candidatus Omnitrophota bacterium]MCG2703498.1 BatD family protein [Candidatus Omnitrophota bacterium]
MKRFFGGVIFACIFMAQGIFAAYAKDIPFEISLERNYVEVGDVLQLGLVFENTQGVSAPQLPDIDGFKSQYIGPSTKMTIVNGRMSSSITHYYKLVAIKKGTFSIGPLSFSFKGDTYSAAAVTVTVADRGQAGRQPSNISPLPAREEPHLEQELDGKIFMSLSAKKTQVYLNERISVTLKLYVNQLTVRDIQYPAFEGEGYTKEEFSSPRQYREQMNGRFYDVVEFNTEISPTREGEIVVGPANLQCKIVGKKERRNRGFGLNDFFDDSVFGDFFGRTQLFSMEVKSAEAVIKVLPLPEEQRPAEFSGAVGDFQMKVQSAPLEVRAGDPITLTMTISGTGNFDSVQSPVLASAEGFKAYSPQLQEKGNEKVFEQVIIPQEEIIERIPAINFAFFNPDEKRYVVLNQGAVPIKVLPAAEKKGAVVAAAQQQKQPPTTTQILGKDIVYIKDDIGHLQPRGEYLHRNARFMAMQLLPLFMLAGAAIFRRRKERLISDVRYARKLRAPKIARIKIKAAKNYLNQNNPEAFYNEIFKTLQEYLGHRFNRSSAGITAEVVDELIRGEWLAADIGGKLKTCFNDCDTARYAAAAFDKEKMRQALAILEETIDYLERKRG